MAQTKERRTVVTDVDGFFELLDGAISQAPTATTRALLIRQATREWLAEQDWFDPKPLGWLIDKSTGTLVQSPDGHPKARTTKATPQNPPRKRRSRAR